MESVSPVYVADLFPRLHHELIRILRGLGGDDWARPTVARDWQVRDVVAHLLDVELRRLSVSRDGHRLAPEKPLRGYDDLVRFLNALNADWVTAARRLSPRVLVELLSAVGPLSHEHLASLPPHERSPFPVSWAGESESENWFDIGREYTERWHHQMQIRDAVDVPLLLQRRWFYPLLDLSFRALPHAYRDTHAPNDTAVVVRVTGNAGGTWSLVRHSDGWRLYRGSAPMHAVAVTLEPDAAWRMLYNALPLEEARRRVGVEGDASLAAPLLAMRSVMV